MTEPTSAPLRPERVRHELRFRLIEVIRTERLSPHMARITFGGPDLAGFASPGFDDHIKVFFPAPGEDAPALPTMGERGPVFPEGVPRPVARDFTPRRFDAAAGTLEIDFALHESGPATEWARAARPGMRLGIGGPRGSFLVPAGYDWHLLIGDATALPAIARRLEELPAGARALVLAEVEEPADELPLPSSAQAAIRWLHRNGATGEPLVDALRATQLPPGEGYAWIGCESGVAKELRRILVETHGLPGPRIRASGYWRRGAAGVHDSFDD